MRIMEHSNFQARFLHPRYWLTWLGMGCWRLLVLLPYPALIWLGGLLGALMYAIGGYRREIAQKNLQLCFPDMSDAEQEQLLKDNFHSYGIAFFEVGIAWWWSKKRFEKIVSVTGLENIQGLHGQGALLMAIHYSTLEIGASALSMDYPIDGMYRPHKNPVYDFLQARGRRGRNTESRTYPRDDVRGVFKALRKGRIIWYAPDQDYGPKQSIFSTFFGVPAASVTATSRFAKMGQSAVLPFTQIRLPGSRGYRITVHPPIENFPSGDDQTDVDTINRQVEEMVLLQPDQYMWVHRRFKTRPEGEEPVYVKKKKKRKRR